MPIDNPVTSRRGFLASIGVGGATVTGTLLPNLKMRSDPVHDVEMVSSITYAERENGNLHLDLYRPDTKGDVPLVVYVHGGAWYKGDKYSEELMGLGEYLFKRDYAVASINYRLGGKNWPSGSAQFPDHIHDVKAAIRFLRAKSDLYDIDPDRVAVWGESSGGHLAALTGIAPNEPDLTGADVYPNESNDVQAVIDWYGPAVDVPLAGPNPDPIDYVSSDDPPFFILHGGQDQLVDWKQSQQLFDSLCANGSNEAIFYKLPNLKHGFGTQAYTEDVEYEVQHCTPDSAKSTNKPEGPPTPEKMKAFLDTHLQ